MKAILYQDEYMTGSASRIKAYDILRGISILYIVGFWHLMDYSEDLAFLRTDVTLFITYCVLGLFCFLSGVLLAEKYEFQTVQDHLGFYKRRIIRIYPMYIGALAAYVVIGFISIRTLVTSALLLNSILNIPLMTLWFISVIFVLYILTPLLLRKFSTMRLIILSLIACMAFIIINITTGYIDLRLPMYLVPFSMGLLISKNPTIKKTMMTAPYLLLSVCLLAISYFLNSYAGNEYFKLFIIDIGILAGINLLMFLATRFETILDNRILRLLSYSSYSMYLIHRVTLRLGVKIYDPSGLLISIVYLAGILLPLTVLGAYLYQAGNDLILNRLGGPRGNSS